MNYRHEHHHTPPGKSLQINFRVWATVSAGTASLCATASATVCPSPSPPSAASTEASHVSRLLQPTATAFLRPPAVL
ncbi:hypothetical protein R6Q57_022179 [Mikania cordata]